MQKRKIIPLVISLLFLTACGNGGSSVGAGASGTVKLSQHQAVGTWKDTFDNTVITISANGTYAIAEPGVGVSNGNWIATSPSNFRMPTSKSYDQEGQLVSPNQVEFASLQVTNAAGNRALTWERM